MALHVLVSLLPASAPSCTTLTRRLQATRRNCISVGLLSNDFSASSIRAQCMATTTSRVSDEKVTNRRSGNYLPPIWGHDFVQSLTNEYVGDSYAKRIENLKEDVRAMLLNSKEVYVDPVHQLELLDTLQRLGVSYHFQEEIKSNLNTIYNRNKLSYRDKQQKQESLYAVSLEFRLLRQHGFDIPTEIFSNFIDENGKFKSCLGDNCKGILALFEAAHLLIEEESSFFHEAKNFTTTYLKEYLIKDNNDECMSTLVNHALELPLHRRMLRLEARWFIDVYEKGPDRNPVLLELAKLDFNAVQATHQQDLKYVSTWWKNTGFGEKLDFARDRLVENFFWTVGEIFEPQFGYCRRMSTLVNALLTTIDDVYDVYGTLDELELFTDAVDRWEPSAAEQLPYYMKLCFYSLLNATNEMAYDALKEQGVDIIYYLKKAWSDICKSYLLEAKWYNSGYKPTFEEYMENAWVSIAGPVMLTHAYVFTANPIRKDALDCVIKYPNIIRWSSTILRLADDLGTSSDELERGDVPKSIQCHMHDTGVSESEARQFVQDLIAKIWMKMNKDRFEKPHFFNNVYIGIAMNLARMAQCMYLYGDGHGVQANSNDRVQSLLFRPIPCTPMKET